MKLFLRNAFMAKQLGMLDSGRKHPVATATLQMQSCNKAAYHRKQSDDPPLLLRAWVAANTSGEKRLRLIDQSS